VADFKCCVSFNGENSFDNGQTDTTILNSVSLAEELTVVDGKNAMLEFYGKRLL
jgi:hypothetical protein